MRKLVALLVGLTFAFGSVGFAVAAGEKKDAKKDNATANATKKEEKPKKKKVEGC